ncbi:MAG: Hpt domain-containing protein [Pseudomonadota bacterium]
MPIHNKKHILDLNSALKASAGNKKLAISLLEVFIQQLSEYHYNIKKYLHIGDYNLLEAIIHKLNGAIQYIGAPELHHMLQELDGKVKTLNRNDIIHKIEPIIEQLELIAEIKEYPEN